MTHPLIFIHGSGDNKHAWRLQIEHFGQQRAFALDLPGHGERADTLPEVATVQEYAQAVYAIIKDELKLARPIIAGHSLGGAIALMMGLEYGNELSGLILVGTGARLRVHPAFLQEAQQAPELAQRHTIEASILPEHIPTLAATLIQDQGIPKAGILYRDFKACDTFDTVTRLHEISLPTLILCGCEDRLTPPKYSQFLLEHLTGISQGAKLHIIPHAGHYVMREQPGMVNQAIEAWLVGRG